MKPKLLVDASLPYLASTLSHYTEALFLPSQEITREAILRHHAEGLLIRSVCRCNASLLEGTPIRFIASATAGMDHIDIPYCTAHNIVVKNAPGCNAPAVAQYLFGALARYALMQQRPLATSTLGIIGVGNVGKQVARYADAIGMKALLYDPIREEQEGGTLFSPLEEVLEESDLLTLHVPLTRSGKYPTYQMIDATTLHRMRKKPLLVNAARGAVVNTEELLQAYDRKQISGIITDCWEGEPSISKSLLEKSFIATPHIAGFSAESKARGSRKITEEMAQCFGLTIDCREIAPPSIEDAQIEASSFGEWTLERCLKQSIDLETIEKRLRREPQNFEQLRVNYSFHREPSSYEVIGVAPSFIQPLQQIGFRC